MAKSFCPECNQRVEVIAPELGQVLNCSRCKTELEVIYLDPLQLDWIYDYTPNDYAAEEETAEIEFE